MPLVLNYWGSERASSSECQASEYNRVLNMYRVLNIQLF